MAGGNKRRRKGSSLSSSTSAKNKKSKAAATAKQQQPDNDEDHNAPSAAAVSVGTIINRLLEYQQDLETTRSLLRTMWQSESSIYNSILTNTSLPSAQAAWRAADRPKATAARLEYWLLLATYTLESLAKQQQQPQAMAFLAAALVPLVVPFRAGSAPGRAVFVRGLLAATSSAAMVLQQYYGSNNSNKYVMEDPQDEMALLAVLLVIDRAIHCVPLGETKGLVGSSGTIDSPVLVLKLWGSTRQDLERHLWSFWKEMDTFPVNSFSKAQQTNIDSCCQALTPPPRGKAPRGKSSESWDVDLFSLFWKICCNGKYENPGYSSVAVCAGWAAVRLGVNQGFLVHVATTLLQHEPEQWACPASELLKETSSSENENEDDRKSRSSSRKRKATTAAEQEHDTVGELKSAVAVVAVASMLLRCIRELKNYSADMSNGGLDAYIDECWNKKLKSTNKNSKKESPDTSDSDYRDSGMLLLFEFVRVHYASLEDLASPDSPLVVNDLDDQTSAPITSYYPFLSQTISQISRLAPSVPSRTQVNERFDCAASAFITRFHKSSKSPIIDARLVNYAVTHTIKILRKNDTHSKGVRGQVKSLVESPVVPARMSGRHHDKQNEKISHSSYGGVYLEEYEDFQEGFIGPRFSGDAQLALLLRAMPSTIWDKRMDGYVNCLLDWIETAYDTRFMEDPTDVVTWEKAADATGRGGSSSSSKTKKSKQTRSRTGKRQKQATDDTGTVPFRRISLARGALATDCLKVLSLFLRSASGRNRLSGLQTSLRAAVTLRTHKRILDLGDHLSRLFVKRYYPGPSKGNSGAPGKKGTILSQERDLWLAHVGVCKSHGRGREYGPQGEGSTHLFRESRLDIYRHIAASCESNLLPAGNDGWPLNLSPTQQIFLLANLDSEERLSTKDYEADHFIVEGSISAICSTLNNLRKYPVSESNCSTLSVFSEMPLSADCCRLILLALIQLPRSQMEKCFTSLVDTVCGCLERLSSRSEEAIVWNKDTSSFVSRVIVLCANAFSFLCFGSAYRKELKTFVSSDRLSLPLFYREGLLLSETNFINLLERWDCPDASKCSISFEDGCVPMGVHLDKVLAKGLDLGFSTAAVDGGHLLYVSWISLGKREVWYPQTRISPPPSKILSPSALILDMRTDVCVCHRIVCRAHGKSFASTSALASALARGEHSKSQERYRDDAKTAITAMIQKATRVITLVKDMLTDSEDCTDIACLCQALCAYVSFAVSSTTRSSGTLFGEIYDQLHDQARKDRRYSTESENTASDADESCGSQDLHESTYERLTEVCERFGAVPSHPDWLDGSCRLLESMSFEEARTLSLGAQNCINELVSVSMMQLRGKQRSAFAELCSSPSPEEKDHIAYLATELCWLNAVSRDKLPLEKFLAEFCEGCFLETSTVEDLFGGLVYWRDDYSDVSWSKNSAQFVHGNLQGTFRNGSAADLVSWAELRAAGEWEVMISRCFLPAIVSGSSSTSPHGPIEQVKRWCSVFWSAVDALCPTSALYWFSLSERGRPSHVLVPVDFPPDEFDFVDSFFPVEKIPQSQDVQMVCAGLQTACLAAFVPDDNTSSAVSMQILPNTVGLRKLRHAFLCRSAFQALAYSSRIVGRRTSPNTKFCPQIMDALASFVDNSSPETIRASLGAGNVEGVRTVMGSSIGMGAYRALSGISSSKLWEAGDEELCISISSLLLQKTSFLTESALGACSKTLLLLTQGSDGASPGFLSHLQRLLNKLSKKDVNTLIKDCIEASSRRHPVNPSPFSLLSVLHAKSDLRSAAAVFDALQKSFSSWKGVSRSTLFEIMVLMETSAIASGKVDAMLKLLFGKFKGHDAFADMLSHVCSFVATFQSNKMTAVNAHATDQLSSYTSQCSYARRSDFVEQHWYQCYTCGLIDDRGCCSVCAAVCHRDHDVVYARHSSFFCDCGGASEDDSLPQCKCLSRNPSFSVEMNSRMPLRKVDVKDFAGLLAGKRMYRDKIVNALSSFGDPSRWFALIFDQLQKSFSKWQANDWSPGGPVANPYLVHRRRLFENVAKGAELACTLKRSEPICRAMRSRPSSFSSIFQTEREHIRSNEISRFAVDADGRGRLAVIERDSVVFCNGLVFNSSTSRNYLCAKEMLPRISSVPLSFTAHGTLFSKGSEGLLAVWGNRSLVIVSSDEDLQSHRLLRPDLAGYTEPPRNCIRKCTWLEGVSGVLVVGCGRAILVYDFFMEEMKPLVTVLSREPNNAIEDFTCMYEASSKMWILFLLIDGQLFSTKLVANGEGRLSGPITHHISPEDSLNVFLGSQEAERGFKNLFALEQSGIVLAQGKGVVGICMDGMETKPFRFLDNEINDSEESISGPYTRWKDLGMILKDGSVFFRAVCMGTHVDSGSRILLVVDFNETGMAVSKIAREGIEYLVDSGEVDGLAAFSAPLLQEGVVRERISLVTISAGGSLSIFEDSFTCASAASVEPNIFVDRVQSEQPISHTPVHSFEKYQNIAESANIFPFQMLQDFSQEAIRTMLLRDSTSHLKSPDLRGFALNVTLNGSSEMFDCNAIAISGVRLLFGATSLDGIPRYVLVQGRKVTISAGIKRWYAIDLSPQEKLLGIRSGIISISIGPTFHKTTAPILDSLEVFSVEREHVEGSGLTSLSLVMAEGDVPDSPATTGGRQLQSSLEAVSFSSHLFKENEPNEAQLSILSTVVRETVLSKDGALARVTRDLISSLGKESPDSLFCLDVAVLSACTHYIGRCGEIFSRSPHSSIICWQRTRPTLRAALKLAADIARLRPLNYYKAIGDLQESTCVCVNALINSCYIDYPLNNEVLADLASLSVLEIAIARAYGEAYDARRRFANFDILQRLVLSRNRATAVYVCEAIAKFCERYSVLERLGEAEVDLFATKAMTVQYQCDGCGVFPIEDIRYSQSCDDNCRMESTVDLCRNCYFLAKEYADSKDRDENEDVVVHGKFLGEGFRLSCAETLKMRSVPIGASEMHESASAHPTQMFQRQQLVAEFIDGLFASLMNSAFVELENRDLHLSPLFNLSFRLSNSISAAENGNRIFRLCRNLVEALSRVLNKRLVLAEEERGTENLNRSANRFVVALSTLVAPEKRVREYLVCPDSDTVERLTVESSDSTVQKCHHGLTARLFCFLNNGARSRSFFCCPARSKARRCNFFMWSKPGVDQVQYHMQIANHAWSFLSSTHQNGMPSVSTCLRNLLVEWLLSSSPTIPRREGKSMPDSTSLAHRLKAEFSDGVYCSSEMLGKPQLAQDWKVSLYSTKMDQSLVESILELMALVANPESDSSHAEWVQPLSEIVFSENEDRLFLRGKAKRVLWAVCGKSPEVFLANRDRFLLQVEFKRLVQGIGPLRDHCKLLKQKCEMHKRQRRVASQDGGGCSLQLAEVVGAVDLLSEDMSDDAALSDTSACLDEMLCTATKRPDNWRNFCCPLDSPTGKTKLSVDQRSPLEELLFASCVLPSNLRLKTMELAAIAVRDISDDVHPVPAVRALDEDDMYAFVVRFVCNDEAKEVRRKAGEIATKVAKCGSFCGSLVRRLCGKPLATVGQMGRMGFEFLELLKDIAASLRADDDVEEVVERIGSQFREQYAVVHSDSDAFVVENQSSSSAQKTRFDTSPCGHFLLRQDAAPAATNTANRGKKIQCQVGPLYRNRLDISRSTAKYNEFNVFVTLPYRCVLSDIYLKIGDPRGRFVKKVNIYASPRPADSPGSLKMPAYGNKWIRCGSIELQKGDEQASLKLPDPVVAANIRIEYAEFYDRPGSPQQDGTFVVHCPRCTRVVTNAHGVCASCGEVAFQCRRCRHINYDRLDAFICIECGYCASGSFSYELAMAVASNAVAITNDKDYRSSVHMYGSVSVLYEDIRSALRFKLSKIGIPLTSKPEVVKFTLGGSDALQRAFDGDLPVGPSMKRDSGKDVGLEFLKKFPKRGSIVRMLALKRGDRRPSSDSTRVSTTVLRHFRADGQDNEDDEDAVASSLLVDLLEGGGNIRGSDASETLSRFLASLQNRSRERSALAEDQDPSNDVANPETSTIGKDKNVDECERLYRLMHEAQREKFALKRRIDAWHRLVGGNLCYETESGASFEPSTCSSCALTIADNLLTLWHAVFRSAPSRVSVSKEMLSVLLANDSYSSRNLQETKRSTVKSIAILSKKFRPLVVEQLRARLLSFHDPHCADIVRSILQDGCNDPELVEPFVLLASDTMDSNPIF